MITFKQFLNEKAMNSGEFNKVQGRQGENARVGFEFEYIMPRDSALFPKFTESEGLRLDRIDSPDEIVEYFGLSRAERSRLESEYDEWVQGERHTWVKAHMDYDAEQLEGNLDQAIEEMNEKFNREHKREVTFVEFVHAVHGSMYQFIKDNKFEPRWGWEADNKNDSSLILTGEDDDEELQNQVFQAVENDLTNFLHANVTTAWKTAKAHYMSGDWIVVPDSSIFDDEGGFGIETNSPPQNLNKALKDLQTMFNWMNANGLETNETTGLHINISAPGIEKIDLVKLVLFMGDKYVLKQFNRVNNKYTKAQSQTIINNVSGTGKIPRDAREMIEIARTALSADKYSSVNISKLKDGYLEFRIAGGVGYQHKYDEIKATVLRFVGAIEIALDPQAEKNEYLKKLSKILDRAVESDSNPDFDARPIIDILEIGDEESARSVLKGFLEQAKKGQLAGESAHQRTLDWVGQHLFPSIQRAFGELSILKPSDRHKADLKLILKHLGISLSELGPSVVSDASWIKKAFGLRK